MRIVIFFVIGVIPNLLLGQNDSFVNLENHIVLSKNTKKSFFYKMDSTNLELYNTKNISDLLNSESGIFIKSYGIGGLNTLSIRGGSAEQSTLKWNGLTLNSVLNGVVDLNTIPVYLLGTKSEYNFSSTGIDNISNSASGSIVLSSATLKKNGLELYTSMSNVKNQSIGIKFLQSTKKLSYNLNVFGKLNRNLYPFINPLNNLTEVEAHAKDKSVDIVQEVRYKFGKSFLLKAGNWLQTNHRQIANGLNVLSRQGYENKHSYSFLHLYRPINKGKLGVEIGHRYVLIDYRDTGNSIFGLHTFNEYNAKLKYGHRFKSSWINKIYAVGSSSYSFPKSDGLISQSLSRILYNFQLGTYHSWKSNSINFFVKHQWDIGYESLPVISLSYQKRNKIIKKNRHTLKAKIASLYRLPTINERFWGGENDLIKSEKGFLVDMGYELGMKRLMLKLSPFYKQVKNYIQWINVNGIIRAENINNTEFYGLDFKAKVNHPFRKFKMESIFSYNYVNAQSKINMEYKYLIFVPKNQMSYVFKGQFNKLNFAINTVVSGKVYTSRDNLSSLKGFSKSDLMFGYLMMLHKVRMKVCASVFNAFNNNYMTIPSNPNPLRHYILSLQLNI